MLGIGSGLPVYSTQPLPVSAVHAKCDPLVPLPGPVELSSSSEHEAIDRTTANTPNFFTKERFLMIGNKSTLSHSP